MKGPAKFVATKGPRAVFALMEASKLFNEEESFKPLREMLRAQFFYAREKLIGLFTDILQRHG